MPSPETPPALLREPKPLYHHPHRLALLFSAKSGCTYAVKWFFHHAGVLADAMAFSRWIHDYRRKVFYRREGYDDELRWVMDGGTRILKVVRHPLTRAVSSFLHVVRDGYDIERASAFFGRPLGLGSGISFREWVTYLEHEDLRDCNIHHRLQAHEAELEGLVRPGVIIRLEEGSAPFERLEEEWGLPRADHEGLQPSHHHTRRRTDDDRFYGDEIAALGPEFDGELPPTENFYDDDLRRRVTALYREDFERYGYE